MAQTKADLMKEAKALGIEHVTAKQTMAELRELIAAAEPKKHDKEALPTEEHEATVAKSGKRSAKAIAEKEAEVAKEERKERAEESAEKPKAASKPARSRLERAGKKLRDAAKLVDATKEYGLNEALDTLVKTSTTKFDATVEVHINLGVDPKQADQNIRDTLVLPHGTGKAVRVAVFADADLHAAAKKAGADVVGADDFLQQLDKGVINFDILIATPATMPKLGKYARLLGPKGLMPNPKSGTVTPDVEKAVTQAKAGRVEYRVDGAGIVHLGVGKVSFGQDKLAENIRVVFDSVKGNKPSSVKGNYVQRIHLATTMGPSMRVAITEL
jgi:large subunit ribosomal protein L1